MKKRQFVADGIVFDSEEEVQFYYYLEQLEESGYCAFSHHLKPFTLCPSVKLKGFTLLREVTYTPDFCIDWNPKFNAFQSELSTAKKTHIFISQNNRTYVDVKGNFFSQKNSSGISFPIKQKFLYHTQNIFTQKIVPFELFQKTFVPDRLKYTKTGRVKKWKFNPKSLTEFLECR